MARIFISYSRVDQEFARRLAGSLSDAGADIWLDVEHIPAGMNWSTAIQQGLDSCDVMLVIISPESMASINVENEWQYALDENKPIIPILWCKAKVHFQLRRIQYIDFETQDYGRAFTRLLRELDRLGSIRTSSSAVEANDVEHKTHDERHDGDVLRIADIRLQPESEVPPEPQPENSRVDLSSFLHSSLFSLAQEIIQDAAPNDEVETLKPLESTTSRKIKIGILGLVIISFLLGAVLVSQIDIPTPAAIDRNVTTPTFLEAASEKIAFVSNRDGIAEIYVMDVDGSNQTRLTNNTAFDSSPVWSPDGSRIVFVSGRDGNSEIYVMNVDGSNQTRLTNNTAFDSSPVWSPDGSRIAFWSDRDSIIAIYLLTGR